MSCFICSCSGHGVCSNLLSFIISILFSFHLFGAVSPVWYCNGKDCDLDGLYYSCHSNTCITGVTDNAVLPLVLIVLCSNLALVVVICFVFNCTHHRFRSLSFMIGIIIGGWLIAQECLTLAILIMIHINYDTVGWSAYVFTLSGMSAMTIVILIILYLYCSSDNKVDPAAEY